MRRQRRIKILATLGPASEDRETLKRLVEAGADVFRINMSHTPHDRMRELVAAIRSVEKHYARPIGILCAAMARLAGAEVGPDGAGTLDAGIRGHAHAVAMASPFRLARLLDATAEIDAAPIDARRGTGLQATLRQIQLFQAITRDGLISEKPLFASLH